MRYDVDVVEVPEQAVVSLRRRGPLAEVGARMRRLRELAAEHGLPAAGPMMALFHEEDMDAADLDYEVCLPVEPRADGGIPDEIAEARGLIVPRHAALQAVHTGPHDAMQDAWRAVREACVTLGCAASGPMTEVYVTGRRDGATPDRFVTRVRLPCAR